MTYYWWLGHYWCEVSAFMKDAPKTEEGKFKMAHLQALSACGRTMENVRR